MKTFQVIAASTVAIVLAACSQPKERVVESPLAELSNQTFVDVTKVELYDSVTVLTADVEFYPGRWVRMTKEMFLAADGKEYRITGVENYELDSMFVMPESGRSEFRLLFEPLPLGTKSFDFKEKLPGGWEILGIDLSGKKDELFNKEYPKELCKEPKDGPLPAPVLAIDSTTIRLHVVGRGRNIVHDFVIISNTLRGEQVEYVIKTDSLGYGEVTFLQHATADNFFGGPDNSFIGSFVCDPGETIDIYTDLRILGRRQIHDLKKGECLNFYTFVSTGKYSDLNRFLSNYYHIPKVGMNVYSTKFANYRMTSSEIMDNGIKQYNECIDSLQRTDCPQMLKDYVKLQLQKQLARGVENAPYMIAYSYQEAHPEIMNRNDIPQDSVKIQFSEADLARLTEVIDFDNERMFLMDYTYIPGVESKLNKTIGLYRKGFKEARNGSVSDSVMAELKALDNNFYTESVYKYLEEAQKLRESMMEMVQPTPDVASEKVFDAIVAPFKGKVVLVDMWNTWCGPCRASIAANEPLKSGELSSDEIVWIYMADETSPVEKYTAMIPDIKGLHYRLNREQWKAICDRFNVDGIPFYILVDRNGKAVGHDDFRNHEEMKKTLLKALK